jgi:caa(3)-type oxidase subunit IV
MATTHHEHHDHGHDHAHHIIPMSKLVQVAVILTVLMIATIVAAQVFTGLPLWAMWFIAMGIAYTKAFFVVQIFMGVRYQTKLVKAFAYGGFIWALLLLVMLTDYLTRPWEPVKGWTPGESSLDRGIEIDRVPDDLEIKH